MSTKPYFAKGIGMDTGSTTIDVMADQYRMDPDKYQNFEDFGFDVCPVDLNGGYVPFDKSRDNLSTAGDNVRRRFNLSQTEPGQDPFIDNKKSAGNLKNNIGRDQ